MGTIVGIALALQYAGGADYQDPTLLGEVSARLAVAFNTTMVALLLSAILVFLQHIVQTYEERVLNRIGQYCLDNLINRLYVSE
jgi:biopolymer transport protein ExbB/TolQ